MARILQVGISLLLTLTVAAGCTPAAELSPDEQAIRATIQRYNQLLTEGYRSLNMNPMQEVADKLQAESEYIHMSSLAEGGIRLDPELKELRFVSVSVEATSAQVETKETWDYRHYSRTTGRLVLEQKGLVYDLAWDLSRKPGGKWLVSDVRAIGATTAVEPTVFGTTTPTPPSGD